MGAKFQFIITGIFRERFEQCIELSIGRVVVRRVLPCLKRRRDENFRDAEPGKFVAENFVLQNSLLDHVVLPDDDRADLFALRRDPEKRAAIAQRHGPLPFGSQRGGCRHREE